MVRLLHFGGRNWVPKFQKSRKSALRRLFSLSQRVKFGKWLRHELQDSSEATKSGVLTPLVFKLTEMYPYKYF